MRVLLSGSPLEYQSFVHLILSTLSISRIVQPIGRNQRVVRGKALMLQVCRLKAGRQRLQQNKTDFMLVKYQSTPAFPNFPWPCPGKYVRRDPAATFCHLITSCPLKLFPAFLTVEPDLRNIWCFDVRSVAIAQTPFCCASAASTSITLIVHGALCVLSIVPRTRFLSLPAWKSCNYSVWPKPDTKH